MIADSHFHFDLLSPALQREVLQAALAIPGTKNLAHGPLCALSAGVWPDVTARVLDEISKLQAFEDLPGPRGASGSPLCLGDTQRTAGLFFAAGLHPCEIHKQTQRKSGHPLEQPLESLRLLAAAGKLSAIGETGFDASDLVVSEAAALGWTKEDLIELQLEAFRGCMAIAKSFGLPLIVHSRKAWKRTLAAIDEWQGTPSTETPPIMIHCYPGAAPDALRLGRKGVYLSFGGVITWPTARRAREALVACPADRILIETDAPDLAPVLPSGIRPASNSPFYWKDILSVAARLRNTSEDELGRVAHDNLLTFLKRPPSPSGVNRVNAGA